MFPVILFLAGATAIFISSDTRHKKIEEEDDSEVPPHLKESCSGKILSSSFGDQTLHLCHLDQNQDGIYQSSSEDLSAWDGKQWTSFKNLENFQFYKNKFGLPEFEGLRLHQWQRARNFIYSSKNSEKWNVETEKKVSDIAEYHSQKGINIDQSLQSASKSLASGWFQKPTSQQKLNALNVSSVLNSIKNTSFYHSHESFIDSVSQKFEQKKLLFPEDLKGEAQKDASAEIAGAQYNPSINSIRLINSKNLKLDEYDDAIVHELFHFYQDIEKKKISRTGSEIEAYLIEADYLLSKAGLHKGEAAPEKLEEFIGEYCEKRKLPKPPEELEPDFPIVFALRAVYYQKHGDKTLEEENLEQLAFSNEFRVVAIDFVNFYKSLELQIPQDFRKAYHVASDEPPDSIIGKLNQAIDTENKMLENQIAAYSKYVNSSVAPDLKEVEKYYKNILTLGCAISIYLQSKALLEGKKEITYPLEFITSTSQLYFNMHLLAAEDGVE